MEMGPAIYVVGCPVQNENVGSKQRVGKSILSSHGPES